MVKVEGYDFVIKYVKGPDNVPADLASRPPTGEKSSLDEFLQIWDLQICML